MQISKVVTTVFTTICAGSVMAVPTADGPTNDIAPPTGHGGGNGNIKCGQGKHKDFQDVCCSKAYTGQITCKVLGILDSLTGNAVECTGEAGQSDPQQLCCSNMGSGTQICVNNSGDKLDDSHEYRMV
ncbi:hypothetical protein V496_02904 [Pseudogymnoascus sp. VKM F-4515 (FW-2607)]|nr:hypothetical protein V496_02904 [Pseudogymnoascus sp. VKM F-4515 (FW-2607)]